MFAAACSSALTFAFLITVEKVGIKTAARMAMTAMTMTSSTMVKALPCFFFIRFLLVPFVLNFFSDKSDIFLLRKKIKPALF